MAFFGRDTQAQAGDLPGAMTDGLVAAPAQTGVLAGFFAGLRNLLGSCLLYNVPKPFDVGQVDVFVTALATPVQLDLVPNFKLPRRRAWGVLNADPVLGNDIWISFSQPSAGGQGGAVLAQGGSLSIPGGVNMNVWMWPVAAGSLIYFYQFA